MTILFLCKAGNAVREPGGYVRALERRGVRVKFLPETAEATGDIQKIVDQLEEPPQLIFHPDTDFVILPSGLERIGIPTALLQADPYAYTHRRLRWAMLFDYVLLLHPGFEERFRAAGHPAPVTLIHAVDMTYFEGPEEGRIYEIASVGRVDGPNYRTRKEVLTDLESRFQMNDWRRNYLYSELAITYRKSKIVVNIGRDDFPFDVSLRFAEAMAAKALFVTRMPCELTSMGFLDGIHFAGFQDRAELESVLRKYLSDENARKRVADAGHDKVLREHTYDARAEQLLERVKSDQGKLQAPARTWNEGRVRRIYVDYFAAHGALSEAASEIPRILRKSPKDALISAALVGRAWSKRLRWAKRTSLTTS